MAFSVVVDLPAALRDELNQTLGTFPLFKFWGPAADISSSRWITDAALHVMRKHDPTLTLVIAGAACAGGAAGAGRWTSSWRSSLSAFLISARSCLTVSISCLRASSSVLCPWA